MRRLLSFTALLSLVWSACGGAMTPAPSVSSPPPPAAKPAQQVSLADVGLDASKLDRTADPCHDFYRYACGAWLDRTEIPKDKAQFGTFNAIYDRNELILREILEQAAQDPGSDPVLQKLGAFYGSCMDEPAIEKAGTSALAPLFAITSKVKD
jgi:putative endopeptidase